MLAAIRTEPIAPTEPAPRHPSALVETAFGCPRNFLDNRFVYVVVSPRARGLSVGVNMNPDKACNFDCLYCEVNRELPPREQILDVDVMADELQRTLDFVRAGGLREHPYYCALPEELVTLRHVTLSGDGEPTYCPNFVEAIQAVVHVRALGRFPFFKIVLITNGTGLDLPCVQKGLRYFTHHDEVWAKLDAGTQAYMDRVNHGKAPLGRILANILMLGRQRPVVLQSLFPMLDGQAPPAEEIREYTRRLRELQAGGAQISLVQIYSATRPTIHSECGHLPLKRLAHIARAVRKATGLKVEVF